MQIERVRIEDVYPVEDEYGNQYLSRDYSLKENQRYIEELAASFDQKTGEPNEPPVLVRDGGIYRIKAGNTRIMAMRSLGTDSFMAIIDDKDTPQSLIEAAIRTDTKKAYEPIERSRFEQQLYLFGTDEYVSETTGRTVEEVRKVRRTIERIEDAAEDMTIDRMIALVEFEDDQDAYMEIVNAKEGEWQKVASDIRISREHIKRRMALKEALDERGIKIVDETPDGYIFHMYTNSAEGLPEDLPEQAVFSLNYAVDGIPDNGFLYVPASEDVNPEEEEKRAQDAVLEEEYEKTYASRLAWFLEHIEEDMPALCDGIQDPLNAYSYEIRAFMGENNIPAPLGIEHRIYSFIAMRKPWNFEHEFEGSRACGFIDITNALRSCGYEPCEEELNLYARAEAALEECEER